MVSAVLLRCLPYLNDWNILECECAYGTMMCGYVYIAKLMQERQWCAYVFTVRLMQDLDPGVWKPHGLMGKSHLIDWMVTEIRLVRS